MRQFVALDMSSHIGYYRMYNQQRRRDERQTNKTGIPSWGREAGRDQTKSNQVSSSSNHGNSGSTPRVHCQGSQVHRNGILGPSKSSQQRSSSRVCLELITPAREQRANQLPTLTAAHKRTSISAQAQASKRG